MDAQASGGNLLGTVISAVGGPVAGGIFDIAKELFPYSWEALRDE